MYWAKRYLGAVLLALVLGLTGFSYQAWNNREAKAADEIAFGVRVYPSVNVGNRGYYRYGPRGYYYNRYYYPSYRYHHYYRPYYYYDPYYYYYDRGGYIQYNF